MTTLLAGSVGAANLGSLSDPIVTLLSALPLGSWPWVAVAVASMALFAYAVARTASVLRPDVVEDLGARHARELTEGAQR